MKTLLLDNYDSFTYNIVQLLNRLGYSDIDVVRNDKITIEEAAKYDRIILSPGPGIPSEAGILLPLIEAYHKTKPILGVCLGHQAIGEVFGGELTNLDQVYHGISSVIKILDKSVIFKGLPVTIEVGRYHSWVVDQTDFPQDLKITAISEEGLIMGLAHKEYPTFGVQFHPESILTPEGEIMLRNFMEYK